MLNLVKASLLDAGDPHRNENSGICRPICLWGFSEGYKGYKKGMAPKGHAWESDITGRLDTLPPTVPDEAHQARAEEQQGARNGDGRCGIGNC